MVSAMLSCICSHIHFFMASRFIFSFFLLVLCNTQYFPPVACCIVMRKSKEIKAFLCSLISAKGQYSAFILCDFETKFLQSFYQKLIKLSRFILVLEQTYKVIRIAYHIHFASELTFLYIVKPCVQCIMQIHICQYWRY